MSLLASTYTLWTSLYITRLTKSRVLPDLPILQRPRQALSLHTVHTGSLMRRTLVQHPPRLRNRHRLHSRRTRWRDIPHNNTIRSP